MPANIQVVVKERTADPAPGSTRLGGMDRPIETPRLTPRRIAVGVAILLLGGTPCSRI